MANKDKNSSVVTAGVVGAALGAVVGASAVVLSDEENRKKLTKNAQELKSKAEKKLQTLKTETIDEPIEEKKVKNKIGEVKKEAQLTKDEIEKTIN